MTTGVHPPVPPWWPLAPFSNMELEQVRELYAAVRTVTPGMIAAVRAWMSPQVPPGTVIRVDAQRPMTFAHRCVPNGGPLVLLGVSAATPFGPDSVSVSVGIESSGVVVVRASSPADRVGRWEPWTGAIPWPVVAYRPSMNAIPPSWGE